MTENSISRIGVSFRQDLNKWSSRITVNKKRLSLGMFITQTEAITAREQAELKYNMAPRPNVTELTQDTLKQLLSYDPETGIFRWLFSDRKTETGAIAGTLHSDPANAYWTIGLLGKTFRAHRLAWLAIYGEIPDYPEYEIDHINQIKHDNRIENLRIVNDVQQSQNKKRPINNTSGCVGVHRHRTQTEWRAKICHQRKSFHLYNGPDFFEACCARKSAEIRFGFHPNHGMGGA